MDKKLTGKLNTKTLLFEVATLKTYKDYRISFNSTLKHNFPSRLDRLGISIEHFNQILIRICKKIKINKDRQGYYNIILKRKQQLVGYIIVKFSTKQDFKDVFILTILDKTMNPKDFDYTIELFEGFSECLTEKQLIESDVVIFDKEFSVVLCRNFKESGEVIGEFDKNFFVRYLDLEENKNE